MREFTDLRNEPGLKKFLDSQLGTLYMMLDTRGFPQLIVRHFDRDLPPAWAKANYDFVQAMQQWVERHPELARLVKVEQPTEVGRDFISRPYHIYHTSTDAYTNWEDPPPPPEELEQMRTTFREAIGKSNRPGDAIIEKVLEKSLLQPTGKTYFDENEKQFVVVEPKFGRDDIERWLSIYPLKND
jgi:hypothetical protein